jgi:hypothetical protein
MDYSNYNIKKKSTDINRNLNEIKNRQLLFSTHNSNYTQKYKQIKFFKTCKKKWYQEFLFNKIVKVNNKSNKPSNIFKFRRTQKILKNSKIVNTEKNHKIKINIIY